MRYFFLFLILSGITVATVFGLRGHKFTQPPLEIFNDMDHQPKIKAQAGSDFFADGLGSRPLVPHTQPVGYEFPDADATENGEHPRIEFSRSGSYYHTGRFGDFYGEGMPEGVKVDEAFLKRGEERYGIYCAVCHGASGNGKGVASKYMAVLIANLQDAPFADPSNPMYRPDGEIFEVITKGRGQMGGYGASVPVNDRWAIVAYLRALQSASKAANAAPAPTPAGGN